MGLDWPPSFKMGDPWNEKWGVFTFKYLIHQEFSYVAKWVGILLLVGISAELNSKIVA